MNASTTTYSPRQLGLDHLSGLRAITVTADPVVRQMAFGTEDGHTLVANVTEEPPAATLEAVTRPGTPSARCPLELARYELTDPRAVADAVVHVIQSGAKAESGGWGRQA